MIFIHFDSVAHLLSNLGWVDVDLCCFTLCLDLPGLMGNGVFSHLFPRQNRISQAEIIMEAKNTIKAKAVRSRPRP